MNHKFIKHTYEDGLRLILASDPAKEVATVLVMAGVGSRYEDDNIAGISHILEHMHYKGTKKWPTAMQVAEYIENIGGEHNAFTSKEYTGYYVKAAGKYLDKALTFLSSIITEPLFPKDELEREKGVILEEVKMYEDLPMEVASSKFEEALFGANSLGRDVIGTPKSIKAVTRDDLTGFKDSFYTSGNTVIVIAGNFGSYNEDKLILEIARLFPLPQSPKKPYPKVAEPKAKKYSFVCRQIEQANMVIGFPGVSYQSPDKYKLNMLALILGGSMSSRMFCEIREKKGLAYAVRTGANSYLDLGSIETFAGVPHDKVMAAALAIIGEYTKITKQISDAEVARAKEIIYGRSLITFEDTNELANNYATQLILNDKILTPKQIMEKYAKISKEDLLETARKYLNPKNMTISLVAKEINEKDIRSL